MNITTHKLIIGAAQQMTAIEDGNVNLIVTSPPYPMIEMWDEVFSMQNKEIGEKLQTAPKIAFELMHFELDKVWKECFRVLAPGGFLCINIGDATRTIGGNFQLYNNHARIISCCQAIGFTCLPNIIWRKQTNAPNKFMGSGMLPCGAYVTLEHEWILIFRKGDKRQYKTKEEKAERMRSSFFWEERNVWFSDVWDIKGTKQKMIAEGTRARSAAYPLEVPYRLINMFSQKGDVVLDPFMGTGTTMLAAILSQRNSIGVEIDSNLKSVIGQNIEALDVDKANRLIKQRYDNHVAFVEEREGRMGKTVKYSNETLGQKVMTKQESEIELNYIVSVTAEEKECSWKTLYESQSDMSILPFYDQNSMFCSSL